MKSVLIRFSFFLFFFSAIVLRAQNDKIESLKTELNKVLHDTVKVNVLNSLALEYEKNDPEYSLKLRNEALELSKKNNFLKGQGNTLFEIAEFYKAARKDYFKAIEYYQSAMKIRLETGNVSGAAECLNRIGTVHLIKNDYKSALENYVSSAEKYESIGDEKSMPLNNIAACYYFMSDYDNALKFYIKALKVFEGDKEKMINPLLGQGNVYKEMGKYHEALGSYKHALKLSEEIKNKSGLVKALNNIGNIYEKLHHNDTALEYYEKSLKIKEELGDTRAIVTSLMNIGNIYKNTRNHLKALEYYQKALNINQDTYNKDGCARCLINIGVLYSELGRIEQAEDFLKRGLVMAELINSKEILMDGNEELSEIYAKKGDFKGAYNHYKQHTQLKDSILNETTAKSIAELNTKYETEKKEKEIESLTKNALLKEAQLESQRNQRNGFIVGIALLVLLIILAYNRYRIKQKASKEIAEKNKEITESISYAKRIQSSFLTSEKYVSQRLPDYFIYYNPRNIVSGDFYWLMDKNNNMYICTADCTGHGIPGAFMSLISMGILNEIIYSKTHITHTDEILNELRRIIIMAVNPEGSSEEGKDGMDAVLCRFDFNNMQLEYSAANNSFFIIRNGELMVFKPDKMPVGKYLGEEKPFTRNTVPIQKGDCIYTFSDGYADQFGGPNNKKFQSKRLKELFLNNCHKPMSVQKEIYEKTLKEWQGGNEQVDDILLMGIRV